VPLKVEIVLLHMVNGSVELAAGDYQITYVVSNQIITDWLKHKFVPLSGREF